MTHQKVSPLGAFPAMPGVHQGFIGTFSSQILITRYSSDEEERELFEVDAPLAGCAPLRECCTSKRDLRRQCFGATPCHLPLMIHTAPISSTNSFKATLVPLLRFGSPSEAGIRVRPDGSGPNEP
jgi:hypothetical protein